MATPNHSAKNEPQPYTVLRAICIDGERVDVGGTVHLTLPQYTELANAGKVGPHDPKAAGKAAAAAKAKAKADAEAQALADSEAAKSPVPDAATPGQAAIDLTDPTDAAAPAA